MKYSRTRIIWYVQGAILLGFIALTFLVTVLPLSELDMDFSEEVQENQHQLLDQILTIVNWPGFAPQSIIMVVTAAFGFFIFRMRREAIFVLFTLLSGVISHFLKILIARPRPTDDLVRIIDPADSKSFPSGHVLLYVIFFGFLTLLLFRLKLFRRWINNTLIFICMAMIFIVPYSRIYVGAHWFTDVLGSALLGIVCLSILSYFYLRGEKAK